LNFGFVTTKAGVDSVYVDRPDEVKMLTGDLKIVHAEAAVHYIVIDPVKYAFNSKSVDDIIQESTHGVLRQVVGDRSLDEVFYAGMEYGRENMAEVATAGLREILDMHDLGIRVTRVEIQNTYPPKRVQEAVEDINRAHQDSQTSIDTAQVRYNTEVPRARGEASQRIRQAEAYAIEQVNQAKGEVQSFLAQLEEFVQSPEITALRLEKETMEAILGNVDRIIAVPEGQGILPLLNLGGGEQ
jgi:modulator of FtsH protease HflK